MSNPTPDRYTWTYQGVTFDFYRLCEILGIKSHAQAHALKKVIRAGKSIKPLVVDIQESIDCMERWKEIAKEDAANGNVYGGPSIVAAGPVVEIIGGDGCVHYCSQTPPPLKTHNDMLCGVCARPFGMFISHKECVAQNCINP